METVSLDAWVISVRATLAAMSRQDFGYPIDVNEVRPASLARSRVPQHLEPLYAAFDGLSLPDVHVGYFIDSAARVESAAARGAPTRLQRGETRPIQVIGSDGGGSLFALGLQDNAIHYLPVARVTDGTYFESSAAPLDRVANDILGFLDRLKVDIEAFVYGVRDYRYMAR